MSVLMPLILGLYLRYKGVVYQMSRSFVNSFSIFVVLLVSILVSINTAYAQDDPASLIIPQQQKLIEQEQLNREIQDFKNWEKEREKEHNVEDANKDKSPENCFTIHEIKLEDNTVFSKRDISKTSSRYLNTCITPEKIAEVITAFSNLYKDKGYITTQVYVKEQNLKSGVLTLNVIEGKVEDVKFGNNATADKVTGYFITPLSKDDVLNVKAIDQTTENLSYIPSYQYKTNVEAGSKAGLSKINISGTKSFPASVYAETDTIGQQYTGHNRYTLGSRIDNPLKLGDSLNLKYVSTFNDASDGKYSRSFIGSWSMPVKWARIGVNSAYSKYLSTIQGQLQSFQSSGTVTSNSFFANGVVFRNKSVKTTLVSTLNLLSTKNYINDALSNTQSRSLANMEVGIMNNLYTPYGGFFHKLTYIRGLNSFGSISDTPTSTYHAQFDAIRFYHLYSIKTDKIFNGKLPFTFQNTIDAQYAWQDVYSQNQFVLGGFYSVRGFRDVNIYSSSGILTRNDIDFALMDYIKPTNKFTQILTNNGKGGLTLGGFFDIGQATSHVASNTTAGGTGAGNLSSGNHGVLAGAGYKIGYTSKYFQTSLTIAHSIKYPDYLTQSVKANDGRVIYLTVRGVW
ncbi:ShlB family large exoprotein secretion/activation protein [Candidatus Deianiraea vastatrix]|uniref:ShlB family large exoprotein secretion/activation protein n=2 Tax=Candidatus Deianiraea vastatrix TaxID=2163644 RepID=A0A5B8XF58_9RICK|nr:ShlB family large exoprotein secretion/activation protein [Candidatus Deianiraea vastatrix]